MRAKIGNSVQVRFALPAEPLRPFVTTYYCTDVTCSPFDPWLEDYLHPEWANIRFLGKVAAQAMIGPGDVRPSPAFAVTRRSPEASSIRKWQSVIGTTT